jgi:hypothetical protein
MISIRKSLLLVMSALLLGGCSVYKAASTDGISIRDVKGCKNRSCFLAHGMEIIDRHDTKEGKYAEIYRGKSGKSGMNYARAAGHGVLDVMTLGLWEVAGTPIEGAISGNHGYIIARAVYPNHETDQFESVEVHNAGNKVK